MFHVPGATSPIASTAMFTTSLELSLECPHPVWSPEMGVLSNPAIAHIDYS
jgi:hypothetical protein